jgi:hypothetical protein
MKSAKPTPRTAHDTDKEAKNEERERSCACCAFPADWLMVLFTALPGRSMILTKNGFDAQKVK